MDIIKSIEHEQMKSKIPYLKVGDTVKVHVRVKEGNRERIQVFEGIVIKKQGGGVNATFEAPSQTQMSTFDVDMNNPVAIYDYKPKGIFAKFSYYVLEFNKTSYIKRVIGVAGDHIKIESGKVYLNGQELNEPYLRDGIKTEQKVFTDIIVPENCVFVMGDNRPQSMDSRSFGCIPLEKVESKVVIRFWPLNKFGKVK